MKKSFLTLIVLFAVVLLVPCIAQATNVAIQDATNSGPTIRCGSPPVIAINADSSTGPAPTTLTMANGQSPGSTNFSNLMNAATASKVKTIDATTAAQPDAVTTTTAEMSCSKMTSNAANSVTMAMASMYNPKATSIEAMTDMTTTTATTRRMNANKSNAAYTDLMNAPPTSTYNYLSNAANMTDLRRTMLTHTSNGAVCTEVTTNIPGGGADTSMSLGPAVEQEVIKDLEAALIASNRVESIDVFSRLDGSYVASRQQSQGNKEVSTQLKRPISKLAPFACEADYSAGCSVRC